VKLRIRRFIPVVLVAAVAAACDDPSPVGGVLTATLVSPHGAEGAAYVTLFGPGILEVGALSARTFSNVRGDTVDVVIVRDQPGELRFTLSVADASRPPAAVVVEVADGENRLRADAHLYRLEVRQ